MLMRMLRIPRFSSQILLVSSFLVVFLMTGCGAEETPPGIPDTPAPPATETLSAPTALSPTATITAEPPIEQPALQRPEYTIHAVLDNGAKTLIVDQSIRIPHPGNVLLDQIQLAVVPNNWRDVFYIHELASETPAVENFFYNGVALTINFADPGWQPGEVLDLKIGYSLVLPEQNARPGYGPSPFGYTALQLNLVDWYPMVVPYQEDSGWLIHDPWIFGEFMVYPVADFEITLDLGGADLVAAASTAAEEADGILNYSLESARNFVISLSSSYSVLEDQVDGTTVYGYYFPGYQIPAQAVFNATVEALRLYNDLYGPYQQPSLSVIQADFNHGMEYQGLYFQSRAFFDTYVGSVESYLVAIAAHETAHQWWYGQVANDQAIEPWLDEAFCTFSELAYYENEYPESVDWWWSTRVNYYQPEGRIDRSIYQYQEYINEQYLRYRNATYLQGAKFLFALKAEMGERLFYDFLREYALTFQGQIATGEDFFNLLESYLDLGEQEWIGEYFERPE